MKSHFAIKTVTAFVLLLSLFAGAALAAPADEREVVVTGIGRTEDEAKIQAYRSAIRNVIGSMVVSSVLVENEALIRDQVLSHSDGFVTKASQIGDTRNLGDGLLEVTMQITVKSQQLQAKLQAEKITVAAMDGQSLFAKKVTQDESRQDAASIIAEKITNLPAGVLIAEADIRASEQKSSPGMVQLTLPVKVSVDKQAYGAFAKDLNATLVKLGFKATPVTVNSGKDYGSDLIMSVLKENFWKAVTGKYSNQAREAFVLGVCDLVNKEAKTSRWKLYSVSKDVFAILKSAEKSFMLSVELRDASDSVISVSESLYASDDNQTRWSANNNVYYTFPNSIISVKDSDINSGSRHAAFAPLPAFGFGSAGGSFAKFPTEVDELVFKLQFDLTEEELKSIQSVRCIVSNAELKK